MSYLWENMAWELLSGANFVKDFGSLRVEKNIQVKKHINIERKRGIIVGKW